MQVSRLCGGLIGTAAAYGLARHLPVVPSTLLSALVLAVGAGHAARLRHPGAWWLLIGAAAGALIGTGCVLAATLHERTAAEHIGERALTLLLLAIAGAVAGRSLSRSRLAPGRAPRDLLRTASTLTTGVFAAIVALTYIHSGLDVARTFSSRLSTSLTILVISVAAPGWLSHLLSRPNPDPDGPQS